MAKPGRSNAKTAWLGAALALCLSTQAQAAGTPAGTVISNVATATYKDINGNPLPVIRSNVVRTTVAQVAGVDVSPGAQRELVAAGTAVVFATEVTNIGNGPDRLNLFVSGLPGEWQAEVLRDADGNGLLDPTETTGGATSSLDLAADESARLLLVVRAPAGGADGQTATAVLQAASQFNPLVSDRGSYTSAISRVVVRLALTATPTDPQPGEVVLFTLRLANIGSSTASKVAMEQVLPSGLLYVPGSMRFGAGSGNSYDVATRLSDETDTDTGEFGGVGTNNIAFRVDGLDPGQTWEGFFQARVEEGLPQLVRLENRARAAFNGPGEVTETVESPPAVLRISPRVGLLARAATRFGGGEPGDLLWFPLEVTNTGNVPDVFAVRASSDRGFATEVWFDLDGDGGRSAADAPLSDSNGDGVADTRRLAAGEVAELLLGATITAGIRDGDRSQVRLALASGRDPLVGDELVFELGARAPSLVFEQKVAPEGSQPPGQTLIYTVVVTNQGSGTASETIVRDAIPEFTTYIPNSVTVDNLARSDVSDGDEVVVKGREVVAQLGKLGPGGSRVVSFRVRID